MVLHRMPISITQFILVSSSYTLSYTLLFTLSTQSTVSCPLIHTFTPIIFTSNHFYLSLIHISTSTHSLSSTLSSTLTHETYPPTDVKRGSADYCGYHSGGYCSTSLAPSVVVQFAFFFDLTNDSGCSVEGPYSPILLSPTLSPIKFTFHIMKHFIILLLQHILSTHPITKSSTSNSFILMH